METTELKPMSLFSSGKYSTLRIPVPGTERRMVIPDGSWIKCRNCGQTLYFDRLEDNLLVCWSGKPPCAMPSYAAQPR